MPDPIELLDRLYASELGCNPQDFNSGRLVKASCERIGGIRFAKGIPLVLFSIAKTSGAVVSVHPRLIDIVDKVLDGRSKLDDEACDALESALNPLINVNFWFRGCRLFCSPETFSDQTFGDVRDVTGLDDISAALHAKWGGRVFGQIVDGRVVSWAAVKPLSDIGWDLSIQTSPEYRGRGYAKSVVSAAVKHVFENGRLATWGTDTTNTASLRTAHSLGFQDYGLDFGCVERMP
jgi:ribosomal protein S18 acetylase RimI-like enzyme